MKILDDLLKKEVKEEQEDKFIHFISSSEGYKPLETPRWLSEIEGCPFCGSSKLFAWAVDKDHNAVFCGRVCLASKLPMASTGRDIPAIPQRALEWAFFCEINGIGDQYHDVRFEKIQQNKGKLDYMLKFASSPKGIILMMGGPGTGKSYAALGICEYFTRSSLHCIFLTQKQLATHWVHTQNDPLDNFLQRLISVPLLVIDDFATGEPNPKFLEFFMGIIDSRLQWKGRGTVITTNLDNKKLANFCGEALADRINTGQIMQFEGGSRRKKTIL
jgi:hypothetical protein